MNSAIDFNVILITDNKVDKNLYEVISQACKAGIKAVQLRNKDIPLSELLTIAKELRSITSEYGAKLIINDRLDIALLTKANGLHSPEGGLEPKHLPDNDGLILGRSVHSLRGAREAEKNGFDYILFGPVYRTPSKVKYGKPQGLKYLEALCRVVKTPVFAVGGINPSRAEQCINAGAFGVAVMREIMLSKNVRRTVNELIKSVKSTRH